MHVIALTGGLGAGKSTASAFFRERGAVVVDLDEVAAHLLQPGSPLLERVAKVFGPQVICADGTLDRAALAEEAFSSHERVAQLNAIVHPAVAAEVGPAVAECRLMPDPPEVIVFEVPLIVEAPIFAELADEIVAISAPVDMRVHRSMKHGRAREDAQRRIALQATDEQRKAIADYVIVNDGTREDFEQKLDDYWNKHLMAGGSRP